MRGLLLFFVLIILNLGVSSEETIQASPQFANNPESIRRFQDRQVRQKIAKDYDEAKMRACHSATDQMADILQILVTNKNKDEAAVLLKQIAALEPKNASLARFSKFIEDINDPQPMTDLQKKDLADRLARAKKARAVGLNSLARTCYSAGLMGYAYDLLDEMIENDPDQLNARKAMGHVKVGNAWHSQYDAIQLSTGQVYVPEYGWVAKANVERVKKGEWFEKDKWMSLEEANKLHKNLDTPWVIETQNFKMVSTATRKQAVELSEKLEEIRHFCFRQYLEFFLRGSPKTGGELLFNQAAQAKMVVNFQGSKADYNTIIMRDFRDHNPELTLRSAGFYSPRAHASYFYYQADYGEFLDILLQHEVTHQILGEFQRGGDPPVWLAEGVAEVLGRGVYNEENRLVLPKGARHGSVEAVAELMNSGKLISVGDLLNLSHDQFHAEPGRRNNYEVSSAFCRFMLEYKNGLYSVDFLEYLNDQYKGTSALSLYPYVALDARALDKAFREYLSAAVVYRPDK